MPEMRAFTVVVIGKASMYATGMGLAACYIDGYGTVIEIVAENEEQAREICKSFGRIKSIRSNDE